MRLTFWSLPLGCVLLASCDRPAAPPREAEPDAAAEVAPPPAPATPPSPPAAVKKGAPPPSSPAAPTAPRSFPFPETFPPSPSPLGWRGVVMRLEFDYPAQRVRYLGTGFVVRDRQGNDWLMTCAHLIGEKEWENRYRVQMRTMRGDRRIESFGSTQHVGTSVDVRRFAPDHWPDMTRDLVIRSVAGDWAWPLPLAKADPVAGEWVWAVGCEARRPPSDEKLFLAKVEQVADGGFVFRRREPFDPRGFSGGPVLNTRGEVVGNLLAGRADLISGATVSVLRRRLQAQGISVD